MGNSFPSTHASGHVFIDLISQSSTNIEPTSLLPHELGARKTHVVGPRRARPRVGAQCPVATIDHRGIERLVRRLVVSDVLRDEKIRTQLKSLAYFQEWR